MVQKILLVVCFTVMAGLCVEAHAQKYAFWDGYMVVDTMSTPPRVATFSASAIGLVSQTELRRGQELKLVHHDTGSVPYEYRSTRYEFAPPKDNVLAQRIIVDVQPGSVTVLLKEWHGNVTFTVVAQPQGEQWRATCAGVTGRVYKMNVQQVVACRGEGCTKYVNK